MDVDDNLDLVPTEYLEPPHGDDVPHILRDQAAELLDGYLRRLARQEALGRRVLGRLAARFLDERAHHALGFARVSDYSRERLGVSGRELQLLARVARRLEALPVLAEAFERGHLNCAFRSIVNTQIADRERLDRSIVNSQIGIVNADIGIVNT